MTLVHGDQERHYTPFSGPDPARPTRRFKAHGRVNAPRPSKSASDLDLEENGLFGAQFELPPMLRQQTRLIVGLALLSLVVLAVVALATWQVNDPSLSHATDASPQNRLGFAGAVIADLMMQLLGFGSLALLYLLSLWGWHMAVGNLQRIKQTKIGAWLLGSVATCGVLAVMPVLEGWPLPIGLGGYVGDLVTRPLMALFAPLPELMARGATGLVYLTLAGFLLRYAIPREHLQANSQIDGDEAIDLTSDPNAEDWQEVENERIGLLITLSGLFTHWSLLLQVRLRRIIHAYEGNSESRSFFAQLSDRLSLAPEEEDGLEAFLSPRERDERQRQRLARATTEVDGGRSISVHRLRDASMPHETVFDQCLVGDDDTLSLRARPNSNHARGTDPDLDVFDEAFDAQPGAETSDPWNNFDRAIQSAAHHELAQTHSELTHNELARGRPVDGHMPPPPPRWRPDAPTDAELNHPIHVGKPAPAPKPGKRIYRDAQPSFLKTDSYEHPPLTLLEAPTPVRQSQRLSDEALTDNARALEGVLEDFGVRGEIINVRPGPVVTLYELEPAPGIKSSRVIGLADDIARSMSAISARVAVIPGKNAIGIELPNQSREMVYLRELIASEAFEKSKAKLALCLGKTIGGEPVIADLARMPHLLVAGTTGSGKSVSINTMILSLLYRHTPERCKMIMIDPKMLELSIYDGIPHLLTPVVTDPAKAVMALKWTVREMEDRYRQMSKLGVRNIDGFNSRIAQARAKGEEINRTVQTGFDPETGEAIFEEEQLNLKSMPYIVVIVDEMADLMMVAGKDIEGAIQRLAQMARAAGIHIIMATQRPSVDVITGTIKANFPTRISFQVTSKIDSRTILGEQGAEQLLGQGDMLYMAGGGRVQRVHGPFVCDDEVEDIVNHLKDQGQPTYVDGVTDEDEMTDGGALAGDGLSGGSSGNQLYDQAVAIVLRDKKASTSYIQRRLSIGYNRAASLIERMEQEGVISSANHAGKREVLVGDGVD